MSALREKRRTSVWVTMLRCAKICLLLLGLSLPLSAQENEVMAKLTFYNATTQKILGNKREAITLFESVVNMMPENAAAHHALADLWAELGRPQQALSHSEQAFKLEPSNRWFGALLAELYEKSNRYQDAIKVYRTMLTYFPDDTDLRYSLIEALDQSGNYKAAIREIRSIPQYEVSVDFAMESEVIVYKNNLKGKKLIKALQESFKYYKGNSFAAYALGEVYRESGKPEEAFNWFKKAGELDPEHPRVHLQLAQISQDAGKQAEAMKYLRLAFENPYADTENKFRILSMMLTHSERYPEWREEAQKLAVILESMYPDDPRASTILGDLSLQMYAFEDALKHYRNAINDGSDVFQLWEQVLRLEASLGHWELLADDARKATELFPTHPIPYLYLGNSLYQQKQYKTAEEAYLNGHGLLFESDKKLEHKFLISMGQLYHYMGEYSRSDSAYEAALDIEPQDALAMNNYAYFLALRGEQLEKALSMADFATRIYPRNPHYLDTRSLVLSKMGRYEEALECIKKALEVGGNKFAEIIENYGDILYATGQAEAAMEEWKKAASMLNTPSESLNRKIETGKP